MSILSSHAVRRIAVVLLLLAAAVALRYTVFRTDPVPVTVTRLATGRVEQTVTNSKAGTVQTRQRASLSPEMGGLVVELPARKGSRVAAGEIVLRLSDADYQAQVALQERSLEAARAAASEACLTAEQAKRDDARYDTLAREGVISAELGEQARSRRDAGDAGCVAARARVRQAESALALARAQLAKTVLRAPFPGVVAELKTELGEWITPAPPGVPIPPVIELIAPEEIYISAPLDEVDVGKVHVGQPVRITMDAYPGQGFPGKVVRVAPYVLDIQEQNRTFEIEAEFDDAEFARNLVPGASADVEVILAAKDGVLRVPTSALMEGNRVLVVENDVLVEKPVTTGLRNWEFVEVTGGLSAGDLVTVSLDRLEGKAGARVRVIAGAAPEAATTGAVAGPAK
jgi:HlyD family secretion protein